MGEAKRRGQLVLQAAGGLRQRVHAGEFGPVAAGAAGGYLLVLDKSPAGAEMLALLRGFEGFDGLAELLAGEAARLWEASSLFPFMLLRGGAGTPQQRTALAATAERLLAEAVPRAAQVLAARGRPWGSVLAVDAALEAPLQQALQRGHAHGGAASGRA